MLGIFVSMALATSQPAETSNETPFAAYAEDDVELNPPPAAGATDPADDNNPIVIALLAAVVASLGLITWRWKK